MTFDVTWGGDATGGADKVATVEDLDQVLDSIRSHRERSHTAWPSSSRTAADIPSRLRSA
jgi:hypothetical protein